MINAVYTPDLDFLSSEADNDLSRLQVADKDETSETEGNVPEAEDNTLRFGDDSSEVKGNTPRFGDNPKEGTPELAKSSSTEQFTPHTSASWQAESDDGLTYTRDETSRQTQGVFSYENSPVQMQFGEEKGIQYPCIYIKTSQDGLEKHKLMALQNVVKADNSDIRLPLYLDVDGSLLKLGSVDNKSLKTLLSNKLFSTWGITIKADVATEYDGDMRLAFCAI